MPRLSTCTNHRPVARAVALLGILVVAGCGRTSERRSGWVSLMAEAARAEYYLETDGLSGMALKTRLHQIISEAVRFNYNQTMSKLQWTDQDEERPDHVIMIYSGKSVPADGDGNGPSWNREHLWAKVRGFPHANMVPYTDLHHLRACEVRVNSMRAAMDFGEVASGQDVPDAPGARYDPGLGLFEPRGEVKGDVARALFYMDVRYQGGGAREPDLRLVEALPPRLRQGVDADGNGYFANLSTLLRWHEQDPVDERERHRNERVWQLQKNRNPFVDHPEFARAIFTAQAP